MTFKEFYTRVSEFVNHHEHRDLEEYLLVLYLLFLQNKNQEPNLDLFCILFEKAFSSDPHPLEENWLNITEAPDRERKDDWEYTMQVIRFQVAELYKMREKQLKNEMRYFGLQSESGNVWYNFDPFTNLERGTACLGGEDEERADPEINWALPGEILECGRIYE